MTDIDEYLNTRQAETEIDDLQEGEEFVLPGLGLFIFTGDDK